MELTLGLLRNPRDLLEKLKRDADLLNQGMTSDRLFNFAVTGYSIIDWIENDTFIKEAVRLAVSEMRQDQWIKICGDIATACKHFTLDARKPITAAVESRTGYGIGRIGVGNYGTGEEGIDVTLHDGQSFPCLEFVADVVRSWEAFFLTHSL
jgi:hypothetical protein